MILSSLHLNCAYIPAGHVGGGTLLPRCIQLNATAQAGAVPKVNGWGPQFSNDR